MSNSGGGTTIINNYIQTLDPQAAGRAVIDSPSAYSLYNGSTPLRGTLA